MTAADTPHQPGSPRAASDAPARVDGEFAQLQDQPAAAWLEAGRTLVLEQNLEAAATVLQAALARHGHDGELALALAGVRWQMNDHAAAQLLLENLLARQPDHAAASFTLARLQLELGGVDAAEQVFRDQFGRHRQSADLVHRAAKMLADAGRKQAAAELCEAAIAVGSGDPFLHVYVAALLGQLGEFERSRGHYLFALEHDPRTIDAGAAYGLASIGRYGDPAHPDLARFEALLQRTDLASAARASVLFALGKAHDDLGDYARAAACLREANALIDHRSWSRKHWRRLVEARLAGMPLPQRVPAATECVPIFVVGAPRSGTTLVAELLGRSAETCNRGELDWLPHLAEEVARAPRVDIDLLDRVAAEYLVRLRQGEAGARWFIDKQPLNFLHVDLIAALFPQARIVHCRRNERDTALSIWSQHFESTEYRFAYDFADIAAVLSGCDRLMARARGEGRVIEVRYEELAQAPQATIDGLAAALGLAPFDASAPNAVRGAIGTASVWQARQPVYTRAIGRWRGYAPFVPELLRFADQ